MRKLATLALIAGAIATPARAGIIISQNNDPNAGRTAFNALLTTDPTSSVVDTSNAFAADPSAATGLASLSRSGTIGGQSYGYTAYDMGYSNSPTGSLKPGTAGGDIDNLSTINVEAPASQDGATGSGTWGLDSGSVGTSTRAALLLDFTSTPGGQGIGHSPPT